MTTTSSTTPDVSEPAEQPIVPSFGTPATAR